MRKSYPARKSYQVIKVIHLEKVIQWEKGIMWKILSLKIFSYNGSAIRRAAQTLVFWESWWNLPQNLSLFEAIPVCPQTSKRDFQTVAMHHSMGEPGHFAYCGKLRGARWRGDGLPQEASELPRIIAQIAATCQFPKPNAASELCQMIGKNSILPKSWSVNQRQTAVSFPRQNRIRASPDSWLP